MQFVHGVDDPGQVLFAKKCAQVDVAQVYEADAIQVVTLGRTENAITVRCDNCDQYTVVVFESEQCDASSSSFKQKNRRRPSPLTLVKSN